MPTLPQARLTLGQIRDLALRRAGNLALTYDAAVWLSQILYDLYTIWDWPFLNQVVTISFVGTTFTLPTDFLKPQDDYAFEILTFDGIPQTQQFIEERSRADFEAQSASAGLTQGMPEIWTADRETGMGIIYPNPIGHAVVAELRYKGLPSADTTPPAIATPTANDAIFPTFPWGLYLVQALTVEVFRYDSDPRADAEQARAEAMLQRIRSAAMPLRAVEPTIPLDIEVFGPPFRSDSSGFNTE